ncbi:MAG: hypothetical protein H7287_12990 [Thermoleophilia bacterium]|nr:hypothetical protein [Thermoleophilia bacterium]
MDPFAQFANNVAYIARDRWRQLAVAVGAAAVAIVIVSRLASQLLGSIDLGSAGGDPRTLGVVVAVVLVAWSIKVALLALLVGAVSAVLADRNDDSFAGWLPRLKTSLPAFGKIAAATTFIAPVLMIWSYQAAVSLMNDAKAAGNLAARQELDTSAPLPISISTYFQEHTLAKLLLLAVLSTAWLAFSTRRALAQRTGKDGPLLGPSPLVTGALACASLLVSGVVLGKVAGSFATLMPGFTTSDGILGSMVGVFVATVVTGALIAAWNVAYDAELATAATAAALPDGVPAGTEAAAIEPTAQAAYSPVQPGVMEAQAAPTFQQVDSIVDAVPNAPAGSWWFVRAGGSVLIEVAGQGAQPQPIAQAADGSWLDVQAGAHPAAGGFMAPTDAWYLLGAWLTDGTPQQVRLRLTLPVDAQAAPAAA